MIIRWITIILFITTTLVFGQTMPPSNAADQAKEFLSMYNIMYQKLVTVSSNAQWNAGTDVTERHTGERIGADQALISRAATIYGGTKQVQKNILAKLAFGL